MGENKLEFSKGDYMLKLRALEEDDIQLLDKWLHKGYIKKWFEVLDICTLDDWLHEVKKSQCCVEVHHKTL